MPLQTKAVSFVLIAFIALGTSTNIIGNLWILPSFYQIEREFALKDMERVTHAIQQEITTMAYSTKDWAAWDDTYQFMQDRNSDYIKANLRSNVLEKLHINVIYLFDTAGKPVWGMTYDLQTRQTDTFTVFPAHTALPEGHPLIALANPGDAWDGIMLTKQGPLLVAARPILTGDDAGPGRGSLMFGRLLNEALVATLSDHTQIHWTLTYLKKHQLGLEETAIVTDLGTTGQRIIHESAGVKRVYQVLPDLFGQPALLLQVDVPQHISRHGEAVIGYTRLTLLAAGLIVLGTLLTGLRHLILRPIQRLTQYTIDATEQNVALLPSRNRNRYDEIGTLTRQFEGTFNHLVDARQALIEQMDKALHKKDKWLRFALHAAHASAWEWQLDIDTVKWSGENYCLLGLKRAGVIPSAKVWMNAIHPEDRALVRAKLAQVLETGEELNLEYRVIWPDGSVYWHRNRGQVQFDDHHRPVKIIGVQIDVTLYKQLETHLEDALKTQQDIAEHLALALWAGDLGLWDWNVQTDHVQLNERWAEMLGEQLEDIPRIYSSWESRIHPDDQSQAVESIRAVWHHQTSSFELEYRLRHKINGWVWVLTKGRVTERDLQGAPAHLCGINLDISRQKSMEEDLHRLATTDPLTGAFNRRYFMESLHKEINRAQRYTRPLSLIMFDIDHFKYINDNYGHDVGDEVLKELALLVRQHLRQNDVFTRWGGEEFIIFCTETPFSEAYCLSERLLEDLRQHPFTCGSVTASFSVVAYQDRESAEQFLKRMDTVLYAAKSNGRNCICTEGVSSAPEVDIEPIEAA